MHTYPRKCAHARAQSSFLRKFAHHSHKKHKNQAQARTFPHTNACTRMLPQVSRMGRSSFTFTAYSSVSEPLLSTCGRKGGEGRLKSREYLISAVFQNTFTGIHVQQPQIRMRTVTSISIHTYPDAHATCISTHL